MPDFEVLTHSFRRSASSFETISKKISTKTDAARIRKIFTLLLKNSDFHRFLRIKSLKTAVFPREAEFSTDPTSPTTATTENLYYIILSYSLFTKKSPDRTNAHSKKQKYTQNERKKANRKAKTEVHRKNIRKNQRRHTRIRKYTHFELYFLH